LKILKCFKKIVKNCGSAVLDENFTQVFIAEISYKLRYKEFIKF